MGSTYQLTSPEFPRNIVFCIVVVPCTLSIDADVTELSCWWLRKRNGQREGYHDVPLTRKRQSSKTKAAALPLGGNTDEICTRRRCGSPARTTASPVWP